MYKFAFLFQDWNIHNDLKWVFAPFSLQDYSEIFILPHLNILFIILKYNSRSEYQIYHTLTDHSAASQYQFMNGMGMMPNLDYSSGGVSPHENGIIGESHTPVSAHASVHGHSALTQIHPPRLLVNGNHGKKDWRNSTFPRGEKIEICPRRNLKPEVF